MCSTIKLGISNVLNIGKNSITLMLLNMSAKAPTKSITNTLSAAARYIASTKANPTIINASSNICFNLFCLFLFIILSMHFLLNQSGLCRFYQGQQMHRQNRNQHLLLHLLLLQIHLSVL